MTWKIILYSFIFLKSSLWFPFVSNVLKRGVKQVLVIHHPGVLASLAVCIKSICTLMTWKVEWYNKDIQFILYSPVICVLHTWGSTCYVGCRHQLTLSVHWWLGKSPRTLSSSSSQVHLDFLVVNPIHIKWPLLTSYFVFNINTKIMSRKDDWFSKKNCELMSHLKSWAYDIAPQVELLGYRPKLFHLEWIWMGERTVKNIFFERFLKNILKTFWP